MTEPQTTTLIIEDEIILRDSLADYLEDRDFRVLKAENGRKGLELFERERPDLVLTDLRMPELDGLDVLRHIQKRSLETPLIVVSGTGNIGDSIQALRLGAWDFILKPVEDLSIILHAMNKSLERARLLRENREYQQNLETLVQKRTSELERANDNLLRINERLRKVVDSTRKLTACNDSSQFGAAVLKEFAEHMQAGGGSIYFLEEDGLRLIHAVDPGHAPEFIPFPLEDNSILNRVIQEKKPLLIQDLIEEAKIQLSGWSGYSNGSVMAFPLEDKAGQLVGVLTQHNKKTPPFTEQDKEIGAILASYSCETLRAARSATILRASEARFRDLVDMLPEAIYETDCNYVLTYVNRRAYEIFGYPPGSLPEGIKALDILAPEERARAREILQRRFNGERVGAVEYQALRKDGTRFPALLHAGPIISDGEITGFRGVVIDITQLRKAEEERERAWKFMQTVIDGIPESLMVVNRDCTIALANRQVREIVGGNDPVAMGMKCYYVSHGSEPVCDGIKDQCPVQQVVEKKAPVTVEHVHQNGEGQSITVEVIAAPIFDEDGNVVQVIESCRDITERIQTEEEKARLEEQYRQAQKVEAIGRLAGGVAHDLNNLLSPILGYGDMLKEDLSPDDERREFVTQIVRAGERARDLVRQLLAFGRKQTLEYRPLNINETIKGFEKLLRRTLRENIDFEIKKAPAVPTVKADIGQLEQVIMNLCVNAQDAMPEGGKLILETAVAELDEHYVMEHPGVKPGSYVMMSVSDTGCGIDAETQKHIFEPFFSTKGEQGTGLGLATVYGIIKQHSGNIWVYSEQGKGTVFKIYIPAVKEKATQLETRRRTSDKLEGSETILLVEDNEQVRELGLSLLKRQGYNVLVAKDGDEASEILKSLDGPLHLLLTDVVMPGINGRELAKRALKKYPGIRVLYMSGYTGDVISHSGILDEGIQFVQKPFTVQGLAAKVRETLEL